MRHHSHLALLAAALASPAAAEVVHLPASRDNTLIETPDGSLSNGAGHHFFAGAVATGDIRRGLIAFDVAAHVPAGSIVTAVSLTLHMSRTPSSGELVSLHRATADWGEGASVGPMGGGAGAPAQPGDATWLHRSYPDEFWSTPGGDFDAAPLASLVVFGHGHYTWSSNAPLVSLVQEWLDEPATNFGLLVHGEEAIDTTAKRFDSREHPDPAVRPLLLVEYTQVPGPSAAAVLAISTISTRRRGKTPPDAGRGKT
jgi:hypothetical protein